MGMWIGQPGKLREITDGAASFDRSPDLGVTEFRALSGGVTTWAPPVQPRRLKVKWSAMERDDVTHLDRLARRVDYPGPVAVLDPLTRNLLASSQALGMGSPAQWLYNANIILYGGSLGRYNTNSVSVESIPASGNAELVWLHPYWTGYPVTPGLTMTWWVPGLIESGAAVSGWAIGWLDATLKQISVTSTAEVGTPLVRTVPDGAAFMLPAVRFSAKGIWPIGNSVLTLGDASAALVSGDRPYGEGNPAYSITDYSHVPVPGRGEFRDIGLDLVEVMGSAAG